MALSTIPKLKRLDLSRNKFNQFHVEDLENFGTPASTEEGEQNGPFCFLEDLDFQFNLVSEEEGLIAPAQALPSLMILNVTGNPFATRGDEFCLNLISGMQSRGGRLINESLNPPAYLRRGVKRGDKDKPPLMLAYNF